MSTSAYDCNEQRANVYQYLQRPGTKRTMWTFQWSRFIITLRWRQDDQCRTLGPMQSCTGVPFPLCKINHSTDPKMQCSVGGYFCRAGHQPCGSTIKTSYTILFLSSLHRDCSV